MLTHSQNNWARRVLLAGAALAAWAPGHAATPTLATRIPDAVASRRAVLLDLPDPSARMKLVIALPQRHGAELDSFVHGLYDPKNPSYRKFLSVGEFTARFGPAQEDYRSAAKFFEASGFKVTANAANNFLFDAEGSVADVERVLHVRMGLYRHPSEARSFLAPDRLPTLDLATPILEVSGLDDFVLAKPRLVYAADQAAPRTTGSGPNGAFIGSDMRAAYYGSGALDGAGQSLGLMELAGYNIASVKTYFKTVNQPLNVKVVGIATDSTPLNCTGKCDDGEQAIDIEYAISVAPGLSQVQVYVGGPEDVLNRMATDNTSKQLSTSWGWNERFATDEAIFKEFEAQGQTNLTASGDYSNLQDSGPWPEESANITGVGGTDLVTDGPGGAWKGETGWNGSAGGPSLDKRIKIQSYQKPFINQANKGSKTLRNVPDVAAQANVNMFFCSNGGCGVAGGTSYASPIWAGYVALANQQAAAAGKPVVGWLNPTLYALASLKTYTKLFHDQKSGKSGVFTCTPSFDDVTGVGSPEGPALIDALVAGPPSPY